MTYALKFAKAAPAIAMSYLSVVWGLLGGYAFFHEVLITAKDLSLTFPALYICLLLFVGCLCGMPLVLNNLRQYVA